jgi:hypothetical protein
VSEKGTLRGTQRGILKRILPKSMCPGKTGRREKKEIMLQIKPVNKPLFENRFFSMISIDKRERICYNM